MSASVAMLEEKLRRAMLFGKYLEQHPVLKDSKLGEELVRSTTYYRIALANTIRELHYPTLKKKPAQTRRDQNNDEA